MSPTSEKAVILSSKRSKTTKKNSQVDKDLTKSPKKKCFEENGAVQNAIKNRTTKNWVEEELSKTEIKRTLKRQSKCHVFVKQVCFSYGESPRTPPLEGTSLHRRNISVERPWGILSLFTTRLPLWVKSSHQSHCHESPTQELIACILRRQSSAIYGVLERTEAERRKAWQKKTHVKAPRKLRKMKPQKS